MSLFLWFVLAWGAGSLPFLLYARHLMQRDDFKAAQKADFLFRWSKETHERMLSLAMYLPALGWPVLLLLMAYDRLKNYLRAKRLGRIIKEKVEKGEYIVAKLPNSSDKKENAQ